MPIAQYVYLTCVMTGLVLEETLVDVAGSMLCLAGLGSEKEVLQALNDVTIMYTEFSEA